MPETPAPVSGLTKIVTPVITVSTSAYAAGDCIGGLIALTDAMRIYGGNFAPATGVLSGLTFLDRSNQKPGLEILIFEEFPMGATTTDNAAFVFGSTADAKLCGKIVVATDDWTTLDGKATAELSNLNIVVKAVGSSSLYAVIVATGAPDFVATTDLQVRFKFFQD